MKNLMRMSTMALIASSICLIPQTSRSIDDAGIFWTSGGVGAAECPKFVAAMELGRRQPYRSADYVEATYSYRVYLMGYQDAYNYVAPKTCDIFDKYSDEQQVAWLEGHCRANPEKSFGSAVIALVRDRHPKRSTACGG